MERRGRISLLGGFFAVLLLGPASVRAEVFLSQSEALALAFPGAKLERRALYLSPQDVGRVEARARVKVSSRLVTAYLAWREGRLAGTAFFDTRTVRTMPAVLMVVVAPDTSVERVEILAFHEPSDYRPTARWLGLFRKRRLDAELWPNRGIRNLGGATLTARAATESARLALGLYQEIVAPRLPTR